MDYIAFPGSLLSGIMDMFESTRVLWDYSVLLRLMGLIPKETLVIDIFSKLADFETAFADCVRYISFEMHSTDTLGKSKSSDLLQIIFHEGFSYIWLDNQYNRISTIWMFKVNIYENCFVAFLTSIAQNTNRIPLWYISTVLKNENNLCLLYLQALSYSVDFTAPEEIWKRLSKTALSKYSFIFDKRHVDIWNDRKAKQSCVCRTSRYFPNFWHWNNYNHRVNTPPFNMIIVLIGLPS